MKILLAVFFLVAHTAVSMAEQDVLSDPVKLWIASQGEIKTWSANLEQIRTLQSLTSPLTAKGHVWFESPGRFRWELGHPPQTIAISTLTNLYIVYPRLKRVESMNMSGDQGGAWRSALEMLEAGFPRSQQELLDHYHILSQTVSGGVCHLIMQPRTAMVRQMMSQLEIDFDTKDHHLAGTELTFGDGSTMRNNFMDVVLNPVVDPQLFNPIFPADYTIVHPMQH